MHIFTNVVVQWKNQRVNIILYYVRITLQTIIHQLNPSLTDLY